MTVTFPFDPPDPSLNVLWRVEERRYSVIVDAEREEYGSSALYVEARWYAVIKKTPRGVWIFPNRFVDLTAKKKFACETVEEAIESFIARKQRQRKILRSQLYDAELALYKVSDHVPKDELLSGRESSSKHN